MIPRALLAALVAGALAACGQPAGTPSSAGEILVVASLTEVDTVNNLISKGSDWARDVERFLFLQLARERTDFESGPATFEPQLAESWEFSEDRLALTFRLREASWSDGAPITADDVRWSWTAQTHPDVNWRMANQKKAIVDVEVLDRRTVRFHFSEAYPDQLDDANDGAILPSHVWSALPFSEWRSNGRWFADNIASSGPFVLERWEPQEMVFRRNPSYFRPGLPKLAGVVTRLIPDKGAQVNQLLGGTVDYILSLPPAQIGRVQDNPATEIDAFWGRAVDYICWNTRRPPLDDARVRRALTQAIDRQTIIDAIYRGHARVAVTVILSTTWAFDDTLEPLPFDPNQARRLLTDAGLTDADGDGVLEWQGEPFSLGLLVQTSNQVHKDAALLLQAELARAGVDLRIEPTEFQTWVERMQANDFEAGFGGWNMPTSQNPSFAFHSGEIGGYNFGHYSNPELDALMDSVKGAGGLEERRRLLSLVQEILHRDQPYTFLWEPQRLNARTSRLRDSRPNALSSFYNVDEWWLDPED